MTAWRVSDLDGSRRCWGSTVVGASDANVTSLVTAAAVEDFDLDFKEQLYGNGDSDKRALAGDVAAMANTAGRLVVIGVQEDEHARAAGVPGAPCRTTKPDG